MVCKCPILVCFMLAFPKFNKQIMWFVVPLPEKAVCEITSKIYRMSECEHRIFLFFFCFFFTNIFFFICGFIWPRKTNRFLNYHQLSWMPWSVTQQCFFSLPLFAKGYTTSSCFHFNKYGKYLEKIYILVVSIQTIFIEKVNIIWILHSKLLKFAENCRFLLLKALKCHLIT